MQSLYPTSPSELSDDDLAELYAYPHERRWVRANFVSTLDGAAQGDDNKSGTLSSRADRRLVGLLRSLCDVIIVGAGTARAEGYQPVQPSEARTAIRTAQGLAPLPPIAIVSRSLELDPQLLAGGRAPTIVLTTQAAPSHLRSRIAEHAPVIVAGELDVDFAVALEVLAGQGYQRMLCEGGPRIMRELVASCCLDELCLTLTPLLTAGDRLRITHGAAIQPARQMQLRHLLEADGMLFARYTKVD